MAHVVIVVPVAIGGSLELLPMTGKPSGTHWRLAKHIGPGGLGGRRSLNREGLRLDAARGPHVLEDLALDPDDVVAEESLILRSR